MSPADRFVAETTIRVRYAETDAMGIVHHASYIVYFEEGRTNYARQRGHDYATFEKSGYYLTVTEMNARYIKPVVYDQVLVVCCWISEMKSRSVTFNYEIVDTNRHSAHVTGYSKHICVTHNGQVAKLPDLWRSWADGS